MIILILCSWSFPCCVVMFFIQHGNWKSQLLVDTHNKIKIIDNVKCKRVHRTPCLSYIPDIWMNILTTFNCRCGCGVSQRKLFQCFQLEWLDSHWVKIQWVFIVIRIVWHTNPTNGSLWGKQMINIMHQLRSLC